MTGPGSHPERRLIAGVLAALLACAPAFAEEPHFDLAHAHAFSGIGLQIWPSKDFPEQRQRVLRDLGVRYVRLGGFGRAEDAELGDAMTPASILAAFRRLAEPEGRSTRALAAELDALGIQVHLVVWDPPAPWRHDKHWNDQGTDRVGRTAEPARTPDYTRYVVAQVLDARQFGFHVAMVEPANEPDGTWNAKWTPEDYADMIRGLRQTMNVNGLSAVGIEGPGTGTMRAAPPFLRALEEGGALGSLGALSVHDWDTRIDADPVGLTPSFRAAVAALRTRLPIDVTEFNDENPRWSHAPFQTGPGRRGPEEAADSDQFAVALSAEALKLVADGAGWASLWQIQDLPWGHDSLGLIDLKGHLRPAERALASWLSLLPAGAAAVGMDPADANVVAAAFRAGQALAVIAINTDTAPHTIAPRIAGVPQGALRIAGEHGFSTAGETAQPVARLERDTLTLSMPPRTIAAVSLALP